MPTSRCTWMPPSARSPPASPTAPLPRSPEARAAPPRPPVATPKSGDPEMASTRDWFETVAEAQRRARRRLPRSVYLAVVAGAEAGVTMHDNVRAFSELRFRPHVAGLPAERQLGTTVMGQDVSLPV